MDFFDKVGDVITSTSKDVVKKAKDIAEAANLKGQIACQEKIINEAYMEIGKAYYEVHKDDEGNLYSEQCNIIEDALEKTAQLNDDLIRLKGIRVCTNCGAEIDENALYCSKCGTRLDDEETAEETAEAGDNNETADNK